MASDIIERVSFVYRSYHLPMYIAVCDSRNE